MPFGDVDLDAFVEKGSGPHSSSSPSGKAVRKNA